MYHCAIKAKKVVKIIDTNASWMLEEPKQTSDDDAQRK